MKTTLGVAAVLAACATFALASKGPAPVKGTVKGRVLFDGKVPDKKPLTITEEQAKGCCEGGKKVDDTDPSLLVGKDDGLANVVVTIEVDGAEVKPAKEIHLDQRECRFEPHVMAVPAGTSVKFLNSDKISHNVHTYARKNDSFNQTIAPGASHEQKLEKEDQIEIKCDIHPWMSSWLVVTDTPYHAVTGPDGSFQIEGLPTGEYTVEVWHEKLGKEKGTAVVKDDGSSDAVEIKLGEEKKSRRR